MRDSAKLTFLNIKKKDFAMLLRVKTIAAAFFGHSKNVPFPDF